MMEHFKGKYEVELKFRLKSKSAFLRTLQSLPFEIMLENNLETDHFFDTSSHELRSNNKTLCIRTMQPSGIKLWIVKGPEADRCEAVDIQDAEKAKSMLNTMGYQEILKTQKIRSIYFIGEYHITLDELDGIGKFAEFAIMTNDESKLAFYKHELLSLAKRFNLNELDLETRSYKELHQDIL